MTLYISPYRRLSTLRQAMDRLFDESLSDSQPTVREMILAVDVQAADDDYTIHALVPGLEADDLNIEIINNTVTIRGEFKAPEEKGNYMLCELPAGNFCRTITLPTALDPAKAEAKIKDGVLVLRVPKAEAHRPKQIKVKVA